MVSASDMSMIFFCFKYISRIVAQDYKKDTHKGFRHRIHKEINCDQGNLLTSQPWFCGVKMGICPNDRERHRCVPQASKGLWQ